MSGDATLIELLWLAGGVGVAGMAAGVLAGFLGVGGGIIMVPVLYRTFLALGFDADVCMHMAVGTSLAAIVPTSLRSVWKHHQAGAVDRKILRRWTPAIILGVIIGGLTAAMIDGRTLSAVFAVVALLVSANLAFGRDHWRLGSAMPGEPLYSGLGVGLGALSAMMGIGGGVFGTSIMTLYGVPVHRAVGTSSGLGVLISIPATATMIAAGWTVADRPPWSLGYVNLVALLFPATYVAVPLGVRLAHSIPAVTLRRAFAAFLAVMAVGMLWELRGG